jgi:hypothetical protein
MIEPNDMIPRGADLTEADIERLADDAIETQRWCFSNSVKLPETRRQIVRTMMKRLGKLALLLIFLPLVPADGKALNVAGEPEVTSGFTLEDVGDCAPHGKALVPNEARLLIVLYNSDHKPTIGVWIINEEWFITATKGDELCLTAAGGSSVVYLGKE